MQIKSKLKIILCLVLLSCTIVVIYTQMSKNEISITERRVEAGGTNINIETAPLEKSEIKVYEKTEDEKEFKEVQAKEEKNNLIKKTNTYTLDTKDITNPENVTNIKPTIADDYIIISFTPAKDNATNYEYIVESSDKNGNKEYNHRIATSNSGIAGYNYVIDNSENTIVDENINKKDNEPILFSGIQWDKDYYIHIKSIDNSGNSSENLTYKIDLPSNGIKMQYIDWISNKPISPEETIKGNVNDEYNVSDLSKNISGYKLINVDGETSGKLKKERINIKFKYAKESTVTIKYIDKLSGKEISNKQIIEGYEGKEFTANPKSINGYKYESGKVVDVMKAGNQEITLYYNKLGKVITSYIDENTGEKIIPDYIQNFIYGENYNSTKKDFKGYILTKVEGDEKGITKSENENIQYYYKKVVQIGIRHIDIDTNSIIEEENIKALEGDKVKIKPKNIEGYIPFNENIEENKEKNISLKEDDESFETEKENNRKKDEKNNKSYDKNLEKVNIIDEILDEDYEKVNTEKTIENNKEKINQEYDIVVDPKKTEYIIYYKKK